MEHGNLVNTRQAGNGYHGNCGHCGLALVTDLGYCTWDNTSCDGGKAREEERKVKEKAERNRKKTHLDLDRPTYISDIGSFCSSSKIDKAIEGLKKEMLKYLKRYEKYDLPPHFLDGITSQSSQAFSQLINEKKILLVNGILKLNKNV